MAAGVGGFGMTDSVYQRLLRERIVFLGSEVRDQNANAICAQLLLLSAEDPEADIFLHINSPGGSVDAGMAIYDTMNYIPNDVATVGMGLAASMGQFLLCAGTKGKRYALPHARIMMHQPLGRHGRLGLGHQDPGPAVAAHQEGAARADRRAHRPAVEQVETDADRDRWFTAEQAAGVRLHRPGRRDAGRRRPGPTGRTSEEHMIEHRPRRPGAGHRPASAA